MSGGKYRVRATGAATGGKGRSKGGGGLAAATKALPKGGIEGA